MLIDCPYCGTRHHREFSYGGDATVVRPPLVTGAPEPGRDGWSEAWQEFVYTRRNPRGRHAEYWHHVAGCRQWLRVERDTLTHEIYEVGPAGGSVHGDRS